MTPARLRQRCDSVRVARNPLSMLDAALESVTRLYAALRVHESEFPMRPSVHKWIWPKPEKRCATRAIRAPVAVPFLGTCTLMLLRAAIPSSTIQKAGFERGICHGESGLSDDAQAAGQGAATATAFHPLSASTCAFSSRCFAKAGRPLAGAEPANWVRTASGRLSAVSCRSAKLFPWSFPSPSRLTS